MQVNRICPCQRFHEASNQSTVLGMYEMVVAVIIIDLYLVDPRNINYSANTDKLLGIPTNSNLTMAIWNCWIIHVNGNSIWISNLFEMIFVSGISSVVGFDEIGDISLQYFRGCGLIFHTAQLQKFEIFPKLSVFPTFVEYRHQKLTEFRPHIFRTDEPRKNQHD